MQRVKDCSRVLLLAAAALCFASPAIAQDKTPQDRKQKPGAGQTEEIVRVNSSLVQTDITVLDKQGRFARGLTADQFELFVDGRPQAISFFEPVMAQEPVAINQAARPRASEPSATTPAPAPSALKSPDRGRVIFFFIDDVHLAPENLIRARKALLSFVDNEMRQNDQVAIVSTSGQIGFLQQLTENRGVLRAAIGRLNNQRNPEAYAGKVAISEYDAAQVSEHFNRELFTYLVEATAAEFQTDLVTAAANVINRVHQVGFNSRTATSNTMGALLGLMRSSAVLPGRKIVFFMTDGFIADPRGSGVMEMLKLVTKTAAQVGAVLYAMDARGTFSDPGIDATQNRYPDFTGSVSRNLLGESTATQEPLQILAADTGGRAIINSNSFQEGFARALDESSSYYLLAWRPANESQQSDKSRVTVRVRNRPDLKVRVRRGFIEAPTRFVANYDGAKSGGPPSSPDDQLRAALASLYPRRELPVALSVGYLNLLKGGTVLTASMKIDAGALDSIPLSDNQQAELDVLGTAIDDRGAIASFKQKVSIDARVKAGNRPLLWNQQMPLAPGLYQVRVAVRERQSGRTGSAMQWLEVPEINSQLAMSSLFLGARDPDEVVAVNVTAGPRPVMVNADRHFETGSVLRFQSYIYNADRAGGAAELIIQARVLRNDIAVLTLPAAKVPTDTTSDQMRLPYWAEIALEKFSAGKYVLEVTAIDRRTKATAMQQASFVVD
jgi:VWFA-related protein